VHASAVTYELPAVILRPFNNYGPTQHLEKLVPRLVTSALLGEPLTVHGDGRASRDWIHVLDTCRAVEAVLDAPLDTVSGQVFNVGTGIATDVLTLARKVAALTGQTEPKLVHTPDRPGQVAHQRCGAGRAAERLGFRAEIDLDRGLAETVEWYRSHRGWWEGLRWMRSVPVMGSDGGVTYW
jgi:dTDP-glucose 4,6-dehydratase